jgi:hypothetical protein
VTGDVNKNKNNIIIIFVLRGLLQVHFIGENWQTIVICFEAFSDCCICTIHCFCRPVLLKRSSLSVYGGSVRCHHWFLENCSVPVIYIIISWFIFFWIMLCLWFCHSLKHASHSLRKV